jgi:hypothetical protein
MAVAANILNEQWKTANKMAATQGLGMGLTTLHHEV